MSKISICTPAHQIPETQFFLERIQRSLDTQTFRDFEWIVTYDGLMAENSNGAIKKATGEIVKVLYMDDYLHTPEALQHLVEAFDAGAEWAVSGCVHDDGGDFLSGPHYPMWGLQVFEGRNTIGSPSVLAFLNDSPELFDERMSWMLDIDLYRRLYKRYGDPYIINHLDIVIGTGPWQMTNTLTQNEKDAEVALFHEKAD